MLTAWLVASEGMTVGTAKFTLPYKNSCFRLFILVIVKSSELKAPGAIFNRDL